MHERASGAHSGGRPTDGAFGMGNPMIRWFNQSVAFSPAFRFVHAIMFDVVLYGFSGNSPGDRDFSLSIVEDNAIEVVVEIEDVSGLNCRHENISSEFSS